MARWYYARDNKHKHGPFSPAQFKQLAVSGQLQPSDMVIREGSRKWAVAASVKGLFGAAPATPPAPPTFQPPPPPPRRPRPRPVAKVKPPPPPPAPPRKSRWKLWLVFWLLTAGGPAGYLAWQGEELRRQLDAAERDRQSQAREAAAAAESARQQLAAARQETDQAAQRAKALETNLAAAEQRVKDGEAAATALRKQLSAAEKDARDQAAAVAAARRRLTLLAPEELATYALDQYALRAPPEAEASLASLAAYLAAPAATDRDKARAIYRWITDRVAYDADGFFAKKRGDNSPEGALKNRLCVCAGYARLFEDLCKRAGVEVALIGGHARGGEEDEPITEANHAWNAVKLDGRWQLVDATWGAGHLKDRQFVKCYNEAYWLAPPGELIFTHLPTEEKWQLLDKAVTAKEFEKLKKVGKDVTLFPGMSEEFRRKLADGSFRGFVKPYTKPALGLLVHQGPVERHLRAGATYPFKIEAAGLAAMACKNGEAWTHFKRKGKVFEGEVEPQKGALVVCGQLPQEGKAYWSLLEYVVE